MPKTPMPPPYRARHTRDKPLRCQHCEVDIWKLDTGRYVDADGFELCMKYTGPIARGEAPPYLVHTPLPVIT